MRCLPLLFALALVATAAPQAQDLPGPQAPRLGESTRAYVGVAVGPGLFAGVAAPQLTVLTQEAAFYLDYDPRVVGQQGQLRLALGIGGSVRLLQVLEIVGDFDADRVDLDAGVRFGPAFDIPFFSPTGEQRTRAFSVMFDPFARGTLRLGGGRVVFAEVGLSEPALRGGFSLGLR